MSQIRLYQLIGLAVLVGLIALLAVCIRYLTRKPAGAKYLPGLIASLKRAPPRNRRVPYADALLPITLENQLVKIQLIRELVGSTEMKETLRCVYVLIPREVRLEFVNNKLVAMSDGEKTSKIQNTAIDEELLEQAKELRQLVKSWIEYHQ